MDTIDSILAGHRPTAERDRVPISISPSARDRLIKLLWTDEFHGVGFSAFIERACEVAETAIAQRRRLDSTEEAVWDAPVRGAWVGEGL